MDCKSKFPMTNRFWLVKKTKCCCPGERISEQVCVTQKHRALSSVTQSGDIDIGCESCIALLNYVVWSY